MVARAIKIAGTTIVVVRLFLSRFAGMPVVRGVWTTFTNPCSAASAIDSQGILVSTGNKLHGSGWLCLESARESSWFRSFQWHLPCFFVGYAAEPMPAPNLTGFTRGSLSSLIDIYGGISK